METEQNSFLPEDTSDEVEQQELQKTVSSILESSLDQGKCSNEVDEATPSKTCENEFIETNTGPLQEVDTSVANVPCERSVLSDESPTNKQEEQSGADMQCVKSPVEMLKEQPECNDEPTDIPPENVQPGETHSHKEPPNKSNKSEESSTETQKDASEENVLPEESDLSVLEEPSGKSRTSDFSTGVSIEEAEDLDPNTDRTAINDAGSGAAIVTPDKSLHENEGPFEMVAQGVEFDANPVPPESEVNAETSVHQVSHQLVDISCKTTSTQGDSKNSNHDNILSGEDKEPQFLLEEESEEQSEKPETSCITSCASPKQLPVEFNVGTPENSSIAQHNFMATEKDTSPKVPFEKAICDLELGVAEEIVTSPGSKGIFEEGFDSCQELEEEEKEYQPSKLLTDSPVKDQQLQAEEKESQLAKLFRTSPVKDCVVKLVPAVLENGKALVTSPNKRGIPVEETAASSIVNGTNALAETGFSPAKKPRKAFFEKKKKKKTKLQSVNSAKSTPDENDVPILKKRGRPPKKGKESPREKKNLRVPVKNVQYSELESSPSENISEVPADTDSTKKKKGERTSLKDLPNKADDKPSVIRHPRRELTQSEEESFFLPEGWLFYASIRQIGKGAGKYDLYYITPPPRIKLRSRQELVNYMRKHDLDYDPLKFFIRQQIDPLLKNGVLKCYDVRTVIVPSTEEVMKNEIFKMAPRHKSDVVAEESKSLKSLSEHQPSSSRVESLDSKRRRFSQKLGKEANRKSRSDSPALQKESKLTQDIVSPCSLDSTQARAKRASLRSLTALSSPKAECVSPDSKPEASTLHNESISTENTSSKKTGIRSSVKQKNQTTQLENEEPSDPQITPPKKRGRPSTRLRTATPDLAPENPEHTVSTPPRKPGRPRKSLATEDKSNRKSNPITITTTPPQQPQSDIEEIVKIHCKPPRKSPYFSNNSATEQSKSLASLRRERSKNDAPPRSPYNLIQEDLFHDPWQMLIATIFLNSTSGRLAIPLALEFLKRWPTPELARQAKIDDILDIIEPLGFGRTRAAIILRFSHEYLTKDWKLPIELYGIGDYGNDSYKIFCMKNAWKKVESDDPMLMMYLNWRRATEHLRKRFSDSETPSAELNEPSETMEVSSSPRKRLRTRTK